MKVLLIGGAGHVGSILRPALEAQHTCYYFDRKPIPGPGAEVNGRALVGDLLDDDAVRRAVAGMDAIVYLAMGLRDGPDKIVGDVVPAFNINVQAVYRVLNAALELGVKRFVYASSMSVYRRLYNRRVDESVPPDAFSPYGLTKRLGEQICVAAAQHDPQAMIVSLRLIHPRSPEQWPGCEWRRGEFERGDIGPHDLQRLFLAALACDKPGAHLLQASGDLDGTRFPNTRALEVLGWKPEGK